MTSFLQETEWSFTDFVVVLLAGLAAEIFVGGAFIAAGAGTVLVVSASLGAKALVTVGLLLSLSRSRGTGNLTRDFGLTVHLGDWWAVFAGLGLQIGAALVISAPLAQLLFEGEPPQQEVAQIAQESRGTSSMLLLVVMLVVVGPVMEELVFRGLLLSRLLRALGRHPAVFVSAGAFAAVHLLDPNAVLVIPGLFVIGIVLGYMALRRGNLSLAILTHAGVNLTAAILLIFGDEILDWLERMTEELEQVETLLGVFG